MKKILEQLYNRQELSKATAKGLLLDIMEEKYNDIQIAAFLSAYNMVFPSVMEMLGFREAMMEKCIKVDLSAYNPMDIVGTGGDGKDTFNISTLASFIAAGAGVNVAKHGNRGVSSTSGSSDVLSALGIGFTNEESLLKKQIEEAGICFLYAPYFHPAMKVVAKTRAAMGVKTVFNLLGPLSNPASTKKAAIGVYAIPIARLYNEVLRNIGGDYAVIHSLDGYDEVSLTGATKIFDNTGEKMLTPNDFGMEIIKPIDLYGGKTAEDASQVFFQILSLEGTKAQNEVVCANAALAISLYFSIPLKEAVERAYQSLNSQEALRRFKILKSLSH